MIYLRGIHMRLMPPESSYLTRLPAVRHLAANERLEFKKPVTFLVGENGAGKSTLLEAIAVAMGFNAEGGSRNFRFSTMATHSELFRYIVTEKAAYPLDGYFLRAESFYNTASFLDRLNEESGDALEPYGGRSLHGQSHGEAFLSLVTNRFGGNGLYLLDEPEAALSPTHIMTLLSEINYLVRKDSQFIISTHSPILMAFPDADILELGENGIRKVGYRETEHYRLTKMFLDDPERMLRYLSEDTDEEH